MNSKSIKIFLGIVLSLFMCGGCKAYYNGDEPHTPITYSQILENLDELVANAFDNEGRLLTVDVMKISQAHWASKIIDIMTERHLVAHWLDNQPANLSSIWQIFEESFRSTWHDQPELQPYLYTPETVNSMRIQLGLY